MSKYQLKAFTIMETIIAMVVTAIVVSMAYTIFLIISRSYSHVNHSNDALSEVVRLDQLLGRDIADAEYVQKENDGILLYFTGKQVRYTFNPDFILRDAIRKDTFYVTAKDLDMEFEHHSTTTATGKLADDLIDELHFTLTYGKDRIPYQYHKTYSATNLYNLNTYANY